MLLAVRFSVTHSYLVAWVLSLGSEGKTVFYPRHQCQLRIPCCQIRLNNWKKTPQRIKLEKLATEVAKCIARFIQASRVCFYWD